MEKHSQRAHALLSASTAERWLNCAAAPRLEDEFGLKKQSVHADEGTTAHELAEIQLRKELEDISDIEYFEKLNVILDKEHYNEEMAEYVSNYVDFCLSQFEEAKQITSDAIILVEQKIDLGEYVPEGFGSNDCIIISDSIMRVIDLKYGKGVAVKATQNKQLMLYGLGAYLRFGMLYDIETINLVIYQPRLDSISTWSISVVDLLYWAETELRDKAKLAFSGKGDAVPGDWCKFCSVKHKCKAFANQNLELAKMEFKVPALLTDEEIAEVLQKASRLSEWASSIQSYASYEAITNGKKWPGYKLVEGTSRRMWKSEDEVIKAIRLRLPSVEDDDIYNTKLKPITEIEKRLGKKIFAETLGDVVIKPAGKLTLVPENDKRPAAGLDQAKADFS